MKRAGRPQPCPRIEHEQDAVNRNDPCADIFAAFIEQAASYGNARGVPTRRLWVSVEQKTQVNARAFLTRHGFHHVATIHELLAKQDALVYLRSLD